MDPTKKAWMEMTQNISDWCTRARRAIMTTLNPNEAVEVLGREVQIAYPGSDFSLLAHRIMAEATRF